MAQKIRQQRSVGSSGERDVEQASFFDAVSWLTSRAEAGPVEMRIRPQLSYPIRELSSIETNGGGVAVHCNLPGLAGAGSPLPAADLSRLWRLEDEHDGVASEVLSVVHQRTLGQLFQAWSKYLLLHASDRARLLDLIAAFAGRSAAELSREQSLAELHVLSHHDVTAQDVEELWHARTGGQIRVRPFRPRSYLVPVDQRTVLPRQVPARVEDRPSSQVLGGSWIIGRRIVERTGLDLEIVGVGSESAERTAAAAISALLETSRTPPQAIRWIAPASRRWELSAARPRALGRDTNL